MTTVTERPGTIDATHVRDVMSMVPTSVTVVAGQPELTGERAAMIVGSFVFISLEPCLVGFFVGHESSSWPQLNKATVLGISTLSSGQAGFCRKLGKKEADSFWTQGSYGAPLVAGAVAAMELVSHPPCARGGLPGHGHSPASTGLRPPTYSSSSPGYPCSSPRQVILLISAAKWSP